MRVKIVNETGVAEALFGLGLSYGITSAYEVMDYRHLGTEELLASNEKLMRVAEKLAYKGAGHNKFLESVQVWLDITAPRFWWSEFDTYRVGTTKQSESTMHTLSKRELTQGDFEYSIPYPMLNAINEELKTAPIEKLKNMLPDGFLQRRIVNTNYKVLQNIINQREGHRLPQWEVFNTSVIGGVSFPEWIRGQRS